MGVIFTVPALVEMSSAKSESEREQSGDEQLHRKGLYQFREPPENPAETPPLPGRMTLLVARCVRTTC